MSISACVRVADLLRRRLGGEITTMPNTYIAAARTWDDDGARAVSA